MNEKAIYPLTNLLKEEDKDVRRLAVISLERMKNKP